MEQDSPEPGYIETRNGRIAWWSLDDGDGTRLPVVFIHGGPGDGCDPAKLERMSLGRMMIVYDQLGCGKSDPIPDLSTWRAEDYADELDCLLTALGLEKVILIGASWGSGLICNYLMKYGMARVAGLVMPSPFLSSQIWYDDQVANMKAMSDTMYLRMMDYVHGRAPADTYAELMSDYYSRYLFARGCNREIAIAVANSEPNPVFKAMWGPNDMVCTGTLKDFDVTYILPEIDVPVLYMAGDSDEVRLETMAEYVESTPGSRLAVIPYAGHALGFEQPDLYRMTIVRFLEENDL